MKPSILIVLALCSLSASSYAKDIVRTLDVKAGGTLDLHTDSGSITIDTHDKDEALIEVLISGKDEDNFTVDIEQNGGDINIKGERKEKKGWGSWSNLKVRYSITLPEAFNIDVKTAGGSIEISDIKGEVDADTSGGSIRIEDLIGDIDIHTSGGSIKAKNIDGEIDAHTSGGSINVIYAKQPSEDASFTTSGGSIHARFPKDIAIDIDARTSGGRVSSEFDTNGRIKKQSIRGTINGGGPEIELRTSGGSISIDKR